MFNYITKWLNIFTKGLEIVMGFCLVKLGLERWWMTHGIGSVGSVAKSMAKAYNRAIAAYPTASQSDILLTTLRSRYAVFGINDFTDDDMIKLVDMVVEKGSDGQLAELSRQIIMLENPAAIHASLYNPEIYTMMLEVIEDVTTKYAIQKK